MSSSYGLRSTGLVAFSGRLVSAVTGLLFALMAARWLSPSGFGTWEVIITLLTFASYPVGTVAYWTTRGVARGRMLGRTALVAGALLSGAGLLIYFGFSFVTFSRIAASFTPFLLGALLVPLSYWSSAANAIVSGYRPSAYGYALVISEAAKVTVAYAALYVYHLGIEGVIVGLLSAYLVQSLASTYLVRGTIAEKFEVGEVKRWSRLAWLPALSYLPTSLAVADTYIVALLHGTAVVGTYQVAFTVATIVTYASYLVFAMYPMLLRGGDPRLPAVSLEFSMLFAIPMAAGCITLAGPVLYLFGPKYVPGALGLAILAVMFVFYNVSQLLDQTLMGTERVDFGETPSFRKLARSNLLFVPAVNIAYGVAYLSALFIAVSYASAAGFSAEADVATWAAVQLAATFVFMLVKVRRAKGVARLVPGVSVVYYLVGAGVMSAAVYFATPFVAVQGVGTLLYGMRLLSLVLGGGAVYFGVVYALDRPFRELTAAMMRRIR
jgi:O-antigen/teichoic acid export membrane protein